MNIHTKWDKQIQYQIRIDPDANEFVIKLMKTLFSELLGF